MDCAPTTGRDAPWSLYLVPTVRSEVDPPFWAISGGERRNERKENDFDGSLDWVTTFWKDLRILDPPMRHTKGVKKQGICFAPTLVCINTLPPQKKTWTGQ